MNAPRFPIARFFERFIYAGRWLLSPMYVGLLVVLGVYVYRYLADLIELCHHFGSLTETDLMLAALAAVDTTMVANLLVFILIGSYSIFVRPLQIGHDAPQWLKSITSGTLKVKMSTSLIGISSIHLLRDFIGAETHSRELLLRHVGIHLVFIISTLALTYADKLAHSHPEPTHP